MSKKKEADTEATGREEVVVVTPKKAGVSITIPAPNFQVAEFHIKGNAPLVVHKFSQKARLKMRTTQSEGSKLAGGKKAKSPRDFDSDYEGARHISREGWDGVSANCFRAAMVSACKLVGYKMTQAKLTLFVLEDGRDADEGTPLVRIIGTPHKHEAMVRNATGVADIRVRPMWDEWSAVVRIRFDADMLTLQDISNLIVRAGLQVGICEGRPDSKASTGCGWGTFEVENK